MNFVIVVGLAVETARLILKYGFDRYPGGVRRERLTLRLVLTSVRFDH